VINFKFLDATSGFGFDKMCECVVRHCCCRRGHRGCGFCLGKGAPTYWGFPIKSLEVGAGKFTGVNMDGETIADVYDVVSGFMGMAVPWTRTYVIKQHGRGYHYL
jgi:hypothetical protein